MTRRECGPSDYMFDCHGLLHEPLLHLRLRGAHISRYTARALVLSTVASSGQGPHRRGASTSNTWPGAAPRTHVHTLIPLYATCACQIDFETETVPLTGYTFLVQSRQRLPVSNLI